MNVWVSIGKHFTTYAMRLNNILSLPTAASRYPRARNISIAQRQPIWSPILLTISKRSRPRLEWQCLLATSQMTFSALFRVLVNWPAMADEALLISLMSPAVEFQDDDLDDCLVLQRSAVVRWRLLLFKVWVG